MIPKLYTLKEMHQGLVSKSITASGAYNKYMPYIKSGRLKVTKIGNQRFVTEDQIREFVESAGR